MEFVEVMRQRNRMCKKYWTERSCHGCPVAKEKQAYAGCCLIDLDPKRYEEWVLQWAAEHPEPVYPTWYEWLTSIGAVTRKVRPDVASNLIETGLLDPIHADMAQKLGIKPKEG